MGKNLHPDHLLLTLGDTEFMDSSGVGLIMGRYWLLACLRCMKACHVSGYIEKLLRLSGVSRFLEVENRAGNTDGREERIMENSNEATIIFDSRPENEGLARVTAAAFCTQLNPTLEEVADLKTAVSEAVTNCIIHGYKGRYIRSG